MDFLIFLAFQLRRSAASELVTLAGQHARWWRWCAPTSKWRWWTWARSELVNGIPRNCRFTRWANGLVLEFIFKPKIFICDDNENQINTLRACLWLSQFFMLLHPPDSAQHNEVTIVMMIYLSPWIVYFLHGIHAAINQWHRLRWLSCALNHRYLMSL